MALRIRSSQTFEAETLRCFFLDLLSTLKPEVFLSSSPKENVGYLRQEILRHFVACSILGKPGRHNIPASARTQGVRRFKITYVEFCCVAVERRKDGFVHLLPANHNPVSL